jgi:hypothetical protein
VNVGAVPPLFLDRTCSIIRFPAAWPAGNDEMVVEVLPAETVVSVLAPT